MLLFRHSKHSAVDSAIVGVAKPLAALQGLKKVNDLQINKKFKGLGMTEKDKRRHRLTK